jgi:hypothetical protein
MDSVHHDRAGVEPIIGLCRFRDEFYSCLGAYSQARIMAYRDFIPMRVPG